MHRSHIFRTVSLGLALAVCPVLARAVTPIASIQDSIDVYDGQVVTIEAIALGDNGDLWPGHTSVYVQDASGKGIQVFDYNTVYTMARGDKVQITGEIEDYQGSNDHATTEIKPTSDPTVVSSGEPLPTPTDLATATANTPEWEGAYVRITGEVTDFATGIGGGTNIGVDDGSGEITVRVWDSIGISLVGIDVGDSLLVTGVISPYSSDHQLLLLDESDYRVGEEWGGEGGGGEPGDPGDLTPIASIQDSIDVYDGQVVTIEAIALVDNGDLWAGHTSVYVQDASGKGIQVFDYNTVYTMARGDKVQITGEIEDYLGNNDYATTEIKPTSPPTVISNGEDLPTPTDLTTAAANTPEWEGAYIQLTGQVTDFAPGIGGGTNIGVDDGSGEISVRVWDSMGINVNNVTVGDSIIVAGVVSPYTDAFQVLLLDGADYQVNGNGGGGGGGVDPDEITPIKTIQDSISIYDGKIVTVEGVVTVGYGKIRDDYTSIYVQDESGRGMNVFDFDAAADLVRGTRVRIQGQVEDYISGEAVYGTTELTNLSGIEVLEVGAELPDAAILSIGESNDPTWDGTLVTINGWVTETPSEAGGGWNVELFDGSGPTTARVWETTGLGEYVAANIQKDALIQVTGIGSVYNDAFQVLACYEEDFVLEGTPPDDFEEKIVKAATISIPRPLFAPTLGEEVRILWNAPPGTRVWVQIFDIEGRAVATLLETTNSPPYGDRAIYWDGRNRLRQRLPTGTYLLNIRAADGGTITSATAPIVIGARLQ